MSLFLEHFRALIEQAESVKPELEPELELDGDAKPVKVKVIAKGKPIPKKEPHTYTEFEADQMTNYLVKVFGVYFDIKDNEPVDVLTQLDELAKSNPTAFRELQDRLVKVTNLLDKLFLDLIELNIIKP